MSEPEQRELAFPVLTALIVGETLPHGEEIYRCPYCGNEATAEECDVMGADWGNLFCNTCGREFAI